MRDLRTLSGPWNGFYVHGKRRCTTSCRLEFCGNRISGSGDDSNGTFQIGGEFFPDHHRVLLDKRYAKFTAYFDGRWDGLQIAGTWTVRFMRVSEEGVEATDQRGTFELWPQIGEQPIS